MQPVTRAGGVVLATEALGEPRRGTILLVMGATASMLWWPESLLRRLAEAGYRVIRFDHRDTGQSTTNPPGETNYGLDDLCADVLAILDHYGAPQAHLVGMSMGGLLSQIVALRQPDRVASLTLIASEPVNTPYEGEGISDAFMSHFARMGELDWTDRRAVSDYLVRSAELSAGPAIPFDAQSARARVEGELDRTTSMQSAFNHAAIDGDVSDLDLETLVQPVLVIHGTDDPVIAFAAGQMIAGTVRKARLLTLEGRGHELLEADIPVIAEAILTLAEEA